MITPDDIERMLELYKNGTSFKDMTIIFGIGKATIKHHIDKAIASGVIQKRKRHRFVYIGKYKVGDIVGDLEVKGITRGENNRGKWGLKCKCNLCGNENFLTTSKYLSDLVGKNCGCSSWERKKGQDSPRYRGHEEISGAFFNKIKKGARARNIEFDLTIEYLWEIFLKQERKCALSNLDLKFGISNYEEFTASLDRIDSSKGYIEGNVQWLNKWVNKMKLDHDQNDFINYCKLIAKNNP